MRTRPEIGDASAPDQQPPPARVPLPLMRLSEPQRWVDFTDYQRHAVPSELEFALGDELRTFCGVTAVVCARKVHHQARWKTCEQCGAVAAELLAAPAGAR